MNDYDALVIGGGIGGIQTSIDLGDQGFKVLMIDKQVSIGGSMIQLSKVFPTLDCGSCITTPKMSAAFNHPNVTTWNLAEPTEFKKNDDRTFDVKILKKARYVDLSDCTGCKECELACPVIVNDLGYDVNMGPKKAIGVPFPTALPQKAALDIDACIFCGRCAIACPTEAIKFDQVDEIHDLKFGTVIIASGFLETPTIKEEYGGGKFTNVLTGKQMERLLAPTGPAGGVFRRSDGKNPWSIAFVQCAGSRDETIGVPYCSAICCMFAIKHAMLLSGAAPMADITIYNMDMRTYGKGHDEFLQEAKNMGINFVKGKIAKIEEDDDKNLTLHLETFDDWEPGFKKVEHDLVTLSLGLVPQWNPQSVIPVALNPDGFVHKIRPKTSPNLTTIPGVFTAGTAMEPKDIVDTIISGSAAAGKASQWLNGGLTEEFFIEELPVSLKVEHD